MTRLLGVLALATAISVVGCKNTGDNSGMNSDNDMANNGARMGGEAASADQRFVMDAAASGMYEVEAGQRAAAKGGNDGIRKLGEHMRMDHQAANDKLMAIAKQKGIMMPPTLTADQKKMLQKLDDASGDGFNKEYLRQQDAAHHDAIRKFQAEANSGADPDVKAFASQTLPTLQEHLQMVQQQENGMK